MRKSAAVAGLAALTLLDISAATPVVAQGASAFQGFYAGAHTGYATTSDMPFRSNPYTVGQADGYTDNDIPISGRNDEFDFDGALVGAHSGFNFITPGSFLFGIEGDWT